MDNAKQDWIEAYKELCVLIKAKVPAIKHIDLYYGQEQMVDGDGNWLPFPSPAVFLDFNATDIQDLGSRAQKITMEVGVYLYRETLSDTNDGAVMQTDALAFMANLRLLHQALHCAEGQHFSPMNRTGINRVDAPPFVQLYRQAFSTEVMDYGATLDFEEEDTPPLELPRTPQAAAAVVDPTPLFQIPL